MLARSLRGPDKPRCERSPIYFLQVVQALSLLFFSGVNRVFLQKMRAIREFWGAGDTQLLSAKKHVHNYNLFFLDCFCIL